MQSSSSAAHSGSISRNVTSYSLLSASTGAQGFLLSATSSPPFLTRSVAGVQHYAQINQTVSEECDILVIQDIGAQWITSPETLF